MKLGIGSYTYAWSVGIAGYPLPAHPMDAVALIKCAADLGVRVVQMADNLPLHLLSDLQLHEVQTLAEHTGIAIEVGTRGIAPDHLRRYLDLAKQFGSPILRVVVDKADHHPEPSEIVSVLRAMMPEFEQARIKLAIENHDRFKVHTLVDMIQQVDSYCLGICLDTVNSFGAGEDPKRVVEALGPYVVNLHIKDFTIRRHPSMLGFEVQGTPAGQGMLDVPWLLDQLVNREFNGILELWTPPEATIEQSIEQEKRWAVESIRYLRTLIKD